jgi:hypothetical protein
VQHVGRVQASPPTTAGCGQLYKVACHLPGQIQRARNLPGPVQAKTFSLPAPPRFTVSRPAAGPQKTFSTERAELRALISR